MLILNIMYPLRCLRVPRLNTTALFRSNIITDGKASELSRTFFTIFKEKKNTTCENIKNF
jgi:hypothetical protein